VRPAEWAETIPVNSAPELGRSLANRRRRLKLTQERVADVTGIERVVVHRLEHGQGDSMEFSVLRLIINALGLDIELRPRGSKFIPRPPTNVTELTLSDRALAALSEAGIHELAELGDAEEMLGRPEFSSGAELYEIVCALSRHGLSLPPHRHVPGEREREMFRLRVVEGLTLKEIGERFGIIAERARQILAVNFGLHGKPPAATGRAPAQPG
jgi:transcriptional regulator with XRE-family HTH domain